MLTLVLFLFLLQRVVSDATARMFKRNLEYIENATYQRPFTNAEKSVILEKDYSTAGKDVYGTNTGLFIKPITLHGDRVRPFFTPATHYSADSHLLDVLFADKHFYSRLKSNKVIFPDISKLTVSSGKTRPMHAAEYIKAKLPPVAPKRDYMASAKPI